jgi:hypothetical protein
VNLRPVKDIPQLQATQAVVPQLQPTQTVKEDKDPEYIDIDHVTVK